MFCGGKIECVERSADLPPVRFQNACTRNARHIHTLGSKPQTLLVAGYCFAFRIGVEQMHVVHMLCLRVYATSQCIIHNFHIIITSSYACWRTRKHTFRRRRVFSGCTFLCVVITIAVKLTVCVCVFVCVRSSTQYSVCCRTAEDFTRRRLLRAATTNIIYGLCKAAHATSPQHTRTDWRTCACCELEDCDAGACLSYI